MPSFGGGRVPCLPLSSSLTDRRRHDRGGRLAGQPVSAARARVLCIRLRAWSPKGHGDLRSNLACNKKAELGLTASSGTVCGRTPANHLSVFRAGFQVAFDAVWIWSVMLTFTVSR